MTRRPNWAFMQALWAKLKLDNEVSFLECRNVRYLHVFYKQCFFCIVRRFRVRTYKYYGRSFYRTLAVCIIFHCCPVVLNECCSVEPWKCLSWHHFVVHVLWCCNVVAVAISTAMFALSVKTKSADQDLLNLGRQLVAIYPETLSNQLQLAVFVENLSWLLCCNLPKTSTNLPQQRSIIDARGWPSSSNLY